MWVLDNGRGWHISCPQSAPFTFPAVFRQPLLFKSRSSHIIQQSDKQHTLWSRTEIEIDAAYPRPRDKWAITFLLRLCLPQRLLRGSIYRIVLTQGYSARPFAFTAMTLPDMRRTVTYGFALKINFLLLCERTRFLRNAESWQWKCGQK